MNRTIAIIICYILPLPVLVGALFIGSSGQITVPEYLKLAYRYYTVGCLQGADLEHFTMFSNILFNIRLPRVLLTFLTGAALSTSGAILQGVYRNPLVNSYVLGISSGAAFGAALAITYAILPVNLAAFIGGGLAVLLTYFVVMASRQLSVVAIVLGGMVISGIFTAMLTMIQYLSNPYKLQVIVQWLMGNLHTTSWVELDRAYLPILCSLAVVFIFRWRLNLLSLGDEAAKAVGVNPLWERIVFIVCATVMTTTTVASAGVISFYGLFLPHIVRMLLGADNRDVLPGSMLLGGTLLLVMDTLSRTLFTFELPIGIFTTLIGGAFFIYLMRKNNLNWS